MGLDTASWGITEVQGRSVKTIRTETDELMIDEPSRIDIDIRDDEWRALRM